MLRAMLMRKPHMELTSGQVSGIIPIVASHVRIDAWGAGGSGGGGSYVPGTRDYLTEGGAGGIGPRGDQIITPGSHVRYTVGDGGTGKAADDTPH
jgi:hypothetical protein